MPVLDGSDDGRGELLIDKAEIKNHRVRAFKMMGNSLPQAQLSNRELIIGEKFMKENKRPIRH